MTITALLPYLLVGAGYLIRHFELPTKLAGLLGVAAGPNPLSAPTAPSTPSPAPAAHPVLSDAVSAAIRQAVADVSAGHVASLRTELAAMVQAAVAAVKVDLAPKS